MFIKYLEELVEKGQRLDNEISQRHDLEKSLIDERYQKQRLHVSVEALIEKVEILRKKNESQNRSLILILSCQD